MEQYKYEIITLLAMLFFHIVDDYYLQGILASMKQRIWWIHNDYTHHKYDYDYLVALFEHAFSWAFMISVPAAIFIYFSNSYFTPLFLAFLPNMFIHAIVDDLKANELRLNLFQDQFIHIVQVCFTWYFVVLV